MTILKNYIVRRITLLICFDMILISMCFWYIFVYFISSSIFFFCHKRYELYRYNYMHTILLWDIYYFRCFLSFGFIVLVHYRRHSFFIIVHCMVESIHTVSTNIIVDTLHGWQLWRQNMMPLWTMILSLLILFPLIGSLLDATSVSALANVTPPYLSIPKVPQLSICWYMLMT